MVFLLILITFESFLDGFLRSWTNPEIQDGRPRWPLDQDGRHPKMITQLLCHVMSSPHDADVKGDIFRHTIYSPSLIVIAFIFLALRWGRGAESPLPRVVEDQKSPV